MSISASYLYAQKTDSLALPPPQEIPIRVFYCELATLLFEQGSFSINYENKLRDSFWLRIGGGIGWFDYRTSIGITLMPVYLSNGDHKFEFGAGCSLNHVTKVSESSYNKYIEKNTLVPRLAVSSGYRYQPEKGGIVFRAGLSYNLYYGGPLQVSFGFAF